MPGAAAQGLIWGIMAIGVYITYKILDVADLTVDGSLCTGGAVCVMSDAERLSHAGGAASPLSSPVCWPVWSPALFHTAFGIPAILAGILTQLALYSVNLRIMGWGTGMATKANLPISVDKYNLLRLAPAMCGTSLLDNPIFILAMFLMHHHHRPAVLVLRHGAGLLPPRHRRQPATWPGPRASTPTSPRCWA